MTPHWRLSHAVFRPQRPVSHSVRINGTSPLSGGVPLWQGASNPSASLRDMKAVDFDPLFTNPHTAPYILSPSFLFAAPKKSDREASQLAASVPLLSYRGAAGCAGLKGSHWWAVLCRTEALLSGWKGLLQDDFRWITAVIVLPASSFPLPEPLLPPFFLFHDEPSLHSWWCGLHQFSPSEVPPLCHPSTCLFLSGIIFFRPTRQPETKGPPPSLIHVHPTVSDYDVETLTTMREELK